MKEIIRVHIAKVPYDIELTAKKELEKYLKALEGYAGEPEVYDDMEVRVTELLAESGVVSGGVITLDDIKRVRQILGEPEQLESDDDSSASTDKSAPKRLYRDMDNAVLGGVLSGMAVYLKIDVVIVRVLFVVLLLASFGSASVIYVLLWLFIPAAETTTQKMELKGVEATLESIKEYSSNPENQQKALRVVRSTTYAVLRFIGVTIGLLVSVGAILAVVTVLYMIAYGDEAIRALFVVDGQEWLAWTSVGLMAFSGILLATLGVLLSLSIGRAKYGRRMKIAVSTVVICGLLTFSAGFVGVFWQYHTVESVTQEKIVSTTFEVPSGFKDARKLVATAHTTLDRYGENQEMQIRYQVVPDNYRMVLTSLSNARPNMEMIDGVARVSLKSSGEKWRASYHHHVDQLVIYGPALEEVDVQQGHFEYSTLGEEQGQLTVNALTGTEVLMSGQYNTLRLTGGGVIDATAATVYDLIISQREGGADFRAGVVRSLEVGQSEVCPSQFSGDKLIISVGGLVADNFIYNDKSVPAKTITTLCGEVQIGDGQDR